MLATDQAATAGSLTGSVWARRARVSRLMYRRATAHSSLVSSIRAPTRRIMAASFGKMPTTSDRRLCMAVPCTLVESLERIGAGDLRPVVLGEVHVGQHVLARGIHHRAEL